MMSDDLPYRAEYAKSNRASCKGCKTQIAKDSLRLAVMVQSAFHDGKQPNWFHMKCFFMKQKPKTVGDIADFSSLRYEDQQKLQEKVDACGSGAVLPSEGKGKGKKRGKNSSGLKDFSIEYAKSSRAACRGCEQKIAKDEIRISKTVYDTEVGMKYGGQALWHHVECFAKLRSELEYFECGDALPGFKSLSKDDQKEVLKHLPKIKSEDLPPVKKLKEEPKDEVDKAEDDKKEKDFQEQSKIMYKYRDSLKKHLKKNQMVMLLEHNKQEVPAGEDRILDRLCDIMTFGSLVPCEECKGGQYVFDNNGYICHGDLTEWTKCKNFKTEPKRKPFKIPDELKEEFDFLKKYKYKPKTRIIKYIAPSVSSKKIKKSDEEDGPKVNRPPPPLKNMEFVFLSKTDKPKEELKKMIVKMGGKVGSKVHEKVAAVVGTKEDIEKMGSKMQTAKELGIQVIPESYFDDVKDGGAVSYITTMSLCDWGNDPRTRIPVDEEKSKKSKSIYTKSLPTKVTLKLKGGAAVDPDSELQDVAHIYKKSDRFFNAVLGKTDIQSDKNSYYKLQLLESDSSNRYWVFRSWGRIGTTIGGNKLEDFGSSKTDALESFYELYEEKTGNNWSSSKEFKKMPGRFYPIDVDYGEDEAVKSLDSPLVKSKLVEPVQNLIKMLFDVNTMKKAMLEFELDMEKMPLGKLSKKQIQSAYTVLSEISELIKTGSTESKFIDASNRFYTIIPHDFGVDTPTILSSVEELKNKIDMLDSLMEIEIAYSLLKSEDGSAEGVSPIDAHYKQLKTDMSVLERDSEEFKLLEQYVKNTHAATHQQYDLEIQQIFKIKREKEDRRYKPFRKLHNRKLLWHGSRLTNYVGILSQGLRIAPPEAPTTGYMFGKGIYFADMVSKSANYCCTSVTNPIGLMLLCEVALGDMLECTQAKYITKLPKDKHSCKGLGRTYPNDKEAFKRDDGVEIPLGNSVTDDKIKSSLLYNEYIVYDVAQVNCQYLFQMKFNYKY